MDITRKKQRNLAGGMASPAGIADPAARLGMQDVQGNIEELWRTLTSLKSSTASDFSEYDDAELRRKIRDVVRIIDEHERRIKALEDKFPIFRHCVVQADHPDYLECLFYNPATDTTGAAVNVAKPFALRVTPWHLHSTTTLAGDTVSFNYTSNFERTVTLDGSPFTEEITPYYLTNEVILVAKTNPFVLDEDSLPIVWEDIGGGRGWGGGGGIRWTEYTGP